MPNFSAKQISYVAKPSPVRDGEVITVGADGYTVTSTLSSYTAFHSNPVRSTAGVWSATMKDSAFKVIAIDVKSILTSGHYLSTQLLPTTVNAKNQLVINWVFNVAGTPTDLTASCGFIISVEYGWGSF